MKSLRAQTYYEVLGVSRFASRDEIQRAFELSKQTYQEDSLATYSLFSDEENREILELMSKAFQTLFNPDLRREYDAFLQSRDGKMAGVEEERMIAAVVAPTKAAPPDAPDVPRDNPRPAVPPGDPAATPAPSQAAQDASARKLAEYLSAVGAFNGDVLQRVRVMQGISVDDLANSTKIRKTYIEYVEDENFDSLPAEVYVKGFVTIMANALGLPARQVAEDYMTRYPEHSGKTEGR